MEGVILIFFLALMIYVVIGLFTSLYLPLRLAKKHNVSVKELTEIYKAKSNEDVVKKFRRIKRVSWTSFILLVLVLIVCVVIIQLNN